MKKKIAVLLLALGVFGAAASATTMDGRIVMISSTGGKYVVKVQLKVDAQAGLGGASLWFTFNTASLSYPATPVAGTDYAYAAYSGGLYSSNVRQTPLGQVNVNIEFNGNPGEATNVNTTYTDVVTITFTILVGTSSSNLVWVKKEALADDAMTLWNVGTFENLNTSPLPIQLSSFTASSVTGTSVLLRWKTLSETDNLGFEVQRALEPVGPFESIPGSFIAGHGTTVEPQEYSYTDVNTEGKSWYYRLKQMDRSGAINYSDAVQANVTGVAEEKAMPTVYSLEQNYPNPFNPSTVISYQLPSASPVGLVVYDLLGREVATLVNGMREAGYHKESFNASGLGSGLYFYRLTAGDQTFLKKMLVVK